MPFVDLSWSTASSTCFAVCPKGKLQDYGNQTLSSGPVIHNRCWALQTTSSWPVRALNINIYLSSLIYFSRLKGSIHILKRSWIDAIRNGVKDNLDSLASDNELSLEINDKVSYEKSKLKSFVTTIKYVHHWSSQQTRTHWPSLFSDDGRLFMSTYWRILQRIFSIPQDSRFIWCWDSRYQGRQVNLCPSIQLSYQGENSFVLTWTLSPRWSIWLLGANRHIH